MRPVRSGRGWTGLSTRLDHEEGAADRAGELPLLVGSDGVDVVRLTPLLEAMETAVDGSRS